MKLKSIKIPKPTTIRLSKIETLASDNKRALTRAARSWGGWRPRPAKSR